MTSFRLLRKEILKPTFVLNGIDDKLLMVEEYVKNNTYIEEWMMTLLINLATVDFIATKIIKETIIVDLLLNDDVNYKEKQFIWFIANLSLTDPHLLFHLTHNILYKIEDFNIYEEYSEVVQWSLRAIADNIDGIFAKKFLYIIFKQNENFRINNLDTMHILCVKNPKVLDDFILEDGLIFLFNHFETYRNSNVFLWFIIQNYRRDVYILSIIYDMYKNLLIIYLKFNPEFETIYSLTTIMEKLDIFNDLEEHMDDILNLLDNNFFYYHLLNLLHHIQHRFTEEQQDKFVNIILQNFEEISCFTSDIYCKVLDGVNDIKKYECMTLRIIVHSLPDKTKYKILNRLDNTLRLKCYTYCLTNNIKIPWFVNIHF